MQRILLLLSLVLTCLASSMAEHVDERTARAVGKAFLAIEASAQHLKTASTLELVYKSTGTSASAAAEQTYFYVFNLPAQGFVIVAADDAAYPILGYSDETTFDPALIASNTRKWLEGYKDQLRVIIDRKIPATPEIQALWEKYSKPHEADPMTSEIVTAVSPLLTTKWNQAPYYNGMCPYDYSKGERAVTGCVATAMAQIMKYWNYPATGTGYHSYRHDEFGTLTANFGTTNYAWTQMPNTVNGTNNAVATLMYHCGVSVEMGYGVESSGAYVITDASPIEHCSEYAFKTYFGYKETLEGVRRSAYSQSAWVSLIKGELDADRPVLYAGFGTGGGHAFVCDGYDAGDYFHFNWGWGGAYDGYFYINALNPSGTGTGGGSGGYNSGHQAIIGLEPEVAPPSEYDLRLYKAVSPTVQTINYGEGFTITTNIANYGKGTFRGDYCAAVFDSDDNFIDYVEIKSDWTLESNKRYTNDIEFTNEGLSGMLPGDYVVGIYYRPTGGKWVYLAGGTFANYAEVNVVNVGTGDIELNAALTVTPGSTLTVGKPVTVQFNVVNNGTTTFDKYYFVGLFDPQDGSLVQEIATIKEIDLPPGYTFRNLLTAGPTTVDVEPGSYLIALLHGSDQTRWTLTGSKDYENPIEVTVQEAPMSPDPYENNNTAAQARNLALTFTSGNIATRNTEGSSFHTGVDVDYFKIALLAGYNYTISARLHDSYNSSNGVTYSADAMFSYSTDNGATWVGAFDVSLSEAITFTGSGTILFKVAPFFAGEKGTYLFDMSVRRQRTVGVEDEEIVDACVEVYPNPAVDFIHVSLCNVASAVERIELRDIQGAVVQSQAVASGVTSVTMPIEQYARGAYLVQIVTRTGSIMKTITLDEARAGR